MCSLNLSRRDGSVVLMGSMNWVNWCIKLYGFEYIWINQYIPTRLTIHWGRITVCPSLMVFVNTLSHILKVNTKVFFWVPSPVLPQWASDAANSLSPEMYSLLNWPVTTLSPYTALMILKASSAQYSQSNSTLSHNWVAWGVNTELPDLERQTQATKTKSPTTKRDLVLLEDCFFCS